MILGVTGSFGSGKSTVSEFLAQKGAAVLNADAFAHQCLEPGQHCYDLILREFGKSVIEESRRIDRGKLGKKVFSDSTKLKKLCRIIHPCVKRRFRDQTRKILKTRPGALLVYDVPLLMESGMDREVDKVVVVTTTVKKQTERAIQRFGLTEREVRQRIGAQLPLQEKVKRADFVISTSGSLDETKVQVEKLCQRLKR